MKFPLLGDSCRAPGALADPKCDTLTGDSGQRANLARRHSTQLVVNEHTGSGGAESSPARSDPASSAKGTAG
jgi:hypothetical protein